MRLQIRILWGCKARRGDDALVAVWGWCVLIVGAPFSEPHLRGAEGSRVAENKPWR